MDNVLTLPFIDDFPFDDELARVRLLPPPSQPLPPLQTSTSAMVGRRVHDASRIPDSNEPTQEELTDVVGEDDEFAVIPRHGFSRHSDRKDRDLELSVSHLENGVVLQDMHKVTSSAAFTNGSLKVTDAPRRKRGLQGMTDKGKHILGLGLVVLHCITVVASAQTAKSTYAKDFSAPFFIVYFRSSWRIMVFPMFMVLKYVQRCLRNNTTEPTSFMKTFTTCEVVFGPDGLTARSFVFPTGLLALLWILVQFAHVFAVKFLNNSIVQALFCSETAICYLLSAIILKAPVYVIKVMAVAVALGGVAFMVYSQGRDDLSWEGIAISLTGAVLGSFYMVAFKKLIGKSEDVGQALLVTSSMAVFITLLCWPVVVILNLTGIEYWSWETFPWAVICLSSSLTLVSISLFNLCLTLTSPLLMTLSKLLGIPFNYGVDFIWWNHQFDIYQIIGCVLIGVGFILIAMPERFIAIHYIGKLCGRESKTITPSSTKKV